MLSTLGAFWFHSNLQKLINALWETGTHFPQVPYLPPFFNSFVKKPALQRKLFSPCPLPSQFMCSATGPLELAHISACGQAAQPCEVSQSVGYWMVPTLDFLMELWAGLRIGYFVLSCLWHLSQWPVYALDVGWEEEEAMECLVKLDSVWEMTWIWSHCCTHLSQHQPQLTPQASLLSPKQCKNPKQLQPLKLISLKATAHWGQNEPTCDKHSHR